MQKVAFLGLGTMGGGMAARLLGAGFPVTAWNRHVERAAPLREAGATIVTSPRDAAANADVVISMVADDAASRAVWTADDGALASARPGTVLIESSTLSPAWIEDLAALAAARGCMLLDAPVTGSKPQAAAGEMVFLVGGDAAVLERVRPVLRPMSRDVVHLGPVGSGARMKLVNNFLSGTQTAALAEALAFAEASGLDREAAMSVVLNGAPASPLVKTVCPRMLARDYSVNFMLSLMRKDMNYAAAEAERHGVTLTFALAARDLYDAAIEQGLGDKDFAAVAEAVKRHT